MKAAIEGYFVAERGWNPTPSSTSAKHTPMEVDYVPKGKGKHKHKGKGKEKGKVRGKKGKAKQAPATAAPAAGKGDKKVRAKHLMATAAAAAGGDTRAEIAERRPTFRRFPPRPRPQHVAEQAQSEPVVPDEAWVPHTRWSIA